MAPDPRFGAARPVPWGALRAGLELPPPGPRFSTDATVKVAWPNAWPTSRRPLTAEELCPFSAR